MGLVLLLLAGLALLWVSGVGFVAWMLTHPARRTYSSAVARGKPGDPSELLPSRRFDSWTFRAGKLDLPVWDIPGDDPAGPIVIMTHGWGDSRIGVLSRLNAVLPVASRIIAWDMRGHGEAPGVCRLGTTEVRDLRSLIAHLGAARVVLFGWSLGAGVSIAAAAEMHDAIIIAETPYRVPRTPAEGVASARGLPARIVVRPALVVLRLVLGHELAARRFDRAVWAERFRGRALVIHGTEDEVCPYRDGLDIAAALKGELHAVAGAAHNNLWNGEDWAPGLVRRVREFIGGADGSEHRM